MKKIIKYSLLSLMAGGIVACTGNFEEYNSDRYAPANITPDIVLPTMINAILYTQQNDAQMVEGMIGQLGGHFSQTNRWGGQNFDTYNQSEGWNQEFYKLAFRDIYGNYFKVQQYTDNAGHWMAMANLVRAAAMARVSDTYGPIPYSQVKNGMMYVPYDDHREFYKTIIADLEAAATTLYSYSQELPDSRPLGSGDLIYGGDYALWARFANSMALRVAVRTADEAAVQAIVAHPAGLIESNAHNAMKDPGAESNPYYLHSASWGELRVNAAIVDYMNGYNDPRRSAYFTLASISGHNRQYYGMPSGHASYTMSTAQGYSMPNFTATSKQPVFTAAETQFLLAEAALRGWIAGDAKTHYERGIELSMEQWGVSAGSYITDATSTPSSHTGDTFLGNYSRQTTVKIAWNAESTTEKHLEQIITQKWIAIYPNPIEGWAEYRRTGYPELAPAVDNLSDGVVSSARGARRLFYPLDERDYNTTNYQQAVSNLLDGPDTQATDLFWAKKN